MKNPTELKINLIISEITDQIKELNRTQGLFNYIRS
jgi:hypothetical protein